MTKFFPASDVPEGAVGRLKSLLAGMTSFGQACLGEVLYPGDSAPTPGLMVECIGTGYRDDAHTISVVMRPYFVSRGVFNVVPVPPGPWWEGMMASGVKIR